MQAFAASLGYIGTPYHGWQWQRNLPTVQGELEQALSQIANQTVSVSAAGRTDRGVHATAQIVAFQTSSVRDADTWKRGLNGLTPDTIQVNWVQPVANDFHPRYSALAREYTYLFSDRGANDLFARGRSWVLPRRLDADLMHQAAQTLVGEHDFSSFRGAGCQSLTPMRRVNSCRVSRHGDVVAMTIEANAFVLHMVRNIARGLIEVSELQRTTHLAELLAQTDRNLLGPTAPPEGLYFTNVLYSGQNFPSPAKPTVVTLA